MESATIPLGERLAAARKAQGASQTQVAERLGVAQAKVSSWENGKATIPVDKAEAVLAYCVEAEAEDEAIEVEEGEERPTKYKTGYYRVTLSDEYRAANLTSTEAIREYFPDADVFRNVPISFVRSVRLHTLQCQAEDCGHKWEEPPLLRPGTCLKRVPEWESMFNAHVAGQKCAKCADKGVESEGRRYRSAPGQPVQYREVAQVVYLTAQERQRIDDEFDPERKDEPGWFTDKHGNKVRSGFKRRAKVMRVRDKYGREIRSSLLQFLTLTYLGPTYANQQDLNAAEKRTLENAQIDEEIMGWQAIAADESESKDSREKATAEIMALLAKKKELR